MIPQARLIYWDGCKFIAPDEAKALHLFCLEKHHDTITKFLRRCDFDINGYTVKAERVFVKKKNNKEWIEDEEGTGFVICLHLLGYLFEGQSVDSESFRRYLHPILFAQLEKCFGRLHYF